MSTDLDRQLRRIEASDGFRSSPQLKRLLRFLTDSRDAAPSQYAIATEALGRPASFDSESDPIVRVEMRRLRRRLDEYYSANAEEPVRISIPIHSYGAVIEQAKAAAPRIAVLPLHYATDGDSFALGAELADDLIHELGRSPEVAPLARTSVFALHARGRTAEEIAREAGADWILEGSVRHGDGKYLVRTGLIRCSTMTFAWNRDFACSAAGLPGLPDLMASAVLSTIAGRASVSQGRRLPNAAAHMFYLRGMAAYNQGRTESIRQAMDLFQESIQADPFFVRTKAALQEALLMPFATGMEFVGAREQAMALAADCEALEPGSADALLAAGNAKLACEGNWTGAAADYRRAIDLEPHNVTTYLWYTPWVAICGDLEEAQRMTRYAIGLDPLSPVIQHHLGINAVCGGRLRDAVELFGEGIEMYPEFPPNYIHQAGSLAFLGETEKALRRVEEAAALAGDNPMITSMRGFVLARGGDREQALGIASLLDAAAEKHLISPLMSAFIYSGLGDADAAIERLHTAIAGGSCWMLPLLASPLLETLHHWDGLPSILKRVNGPVSLPPMRRD